VYERIGDEHERAAPWARVGCHISPRAQRAWRSRRSDAAVTTGSRGGSSNGDSGSRADSCVPNGARAAVGMRRPSGTRASHLTPQPPLQLRAYGATWRGGAGQTFEALFPLL
jgi:hypothetical protein